MSHEAPGGRPKLRQLWTLRREVPASEFGSPTGRERMSLGTATHILRTIAKTHESTLRLASEAIDTERQLLTIEERPVYSLISGPEMKIGGFSALDVARAL